MRTRATTPILLALLLLACGTSPALPPEGGGAGGPDDGAAPAPDDPGDVGSPVGKWSAWIDRSPPRAPTLHVEGRVMAPHPGHEAILSPKEPQGINPNDLILDLRLKEMGGVWSQQLAPVLASFRVDDPAVSYDTVTVRFPDGTSRTLRVETGE